MKIPDGMIFMYYPDRKGIKINIESVELIKCKHCKHCIEDKGDLVSVNVCELNHNKVQPDDWFCADGERKENG